jgi:hypothetical protein
MTVNRELAEAIARELAPGHFGHGWRPAFEAEITAGTETVGYMGERAVLEVGLAIPLDLEAPHTECPCGEAVIQHDDPRLGGQDARALLAKVTGIEFYG